MTWTRSPIVITFGVAPALLVYKWGADQLRRLGIFIAGLFVCAGAMRLARFNVLSRREEAAGHKNPGKYTLGLAIPAAASVLVFMVLVAHHAGPYKLVSESVVAGVVLALSYFMVSRIRFRSFKDLRLTRRTVQLGGDRGGFLGDRRDERRLEGADLPGPDDRLHHPGPGRDGAAAAPPVHRNPPGEAGAGRRFGRAGRDVPPRDEEVLRELGAFDDADEEA